MKSVLGRGIFVFGESSCFLFAHELSCHMKLLFCMYAGIHRKQFCMALNSYKFLYHRYNDNRRKLCYSWLQKEDKRRQRTPQKGKRHDNNVSF